MATQEDVRRIAMALPGVIEEEERFGFMVMNKKKAKGLAWVWLERIDPKKARIPQPKVLAVRVGGEEDKDFLLHAAPDVFFTEPHYRNYPAILIRLENIGLEQLETLLFDAWTIQAPKAAVAEYVASRQAET